MTKKVIINVNLEYDLPEEVKTKRHLDDFLIDLALPESYVEDSIDLVKVIDDETYVEYDLPDLDIEL